MPIDYHIDHEQRLVTATAHGILTDPEFFGYQREVWSRPDVAGYDELVDMSAVTKIDLPSADRVRELALFSAAMDPKGPSSKFAIVAPQDLAFGLGRMYDAYRSSNRPGGKEVGVFRSREQAMAFLGRPREA